MVYQASRPSLLRPHIAQVNEVTAPSIAGPKTVYAPVYAVRGV